MNTKIIKQDDIDISKKSIDIVELVDIIQGVSLTSDEVHIDGDCRVVTKLNIKNDNYNLTSEDKLVFSERLDEDKKKAILQIDDIVISQDSKSNINLYRYSNNQYQLIVADKNLFILRGEYAEFVSLYIKKTLDGLPNSIQSLLQISSKNTMTVGVALGAVPSVFPVSVADITYKVLAKTKKYSDQKINTYTQKIAYIPQQAELDLTYASKPKLEQLPYNELLKIKEEYEQLKKEHTELQNQAEETPLKIQFEIMQEMLHQVLTNQTRVENKVDKLQSTLDNLEKNFAEIKKLPREIEEKINRLATTIDEQLTELTYEQKKLDFYINEIKNWFDYYDILEEKSQQYLPEAEYLYDSISKLENPDYSPFVLQYCRALENELLKKIFRAYIQSLIDRNINIEEEFAWDFGKKENGKLNSDKTFKLATDIHKCLNKNQDKWFFELGKMQFNLKILTGKTARRSPLLIDLKQFVLAKFHDEMLTLEYLDEIVIIRDYRNQSAHPNLIGTEQAINFHRQIKHCLITLMQNYKKE